LTLQIRPARLAEAAAIQSIKQIVWPEEETTLAQIHQALSQPNHTCSVALVDDTLVGFMACFVTTSFQKITRLELDLLAVLPEHRGQGIASEMIRTSLQGNTSSKVEFSRALIQVENTGSQKAFQNNGFQVIPEPLTLFVTSHHGQNGSPQRSGISGHLVPVITLGYSGYWIEPPFSTESMILPEPFQTAGALLPRDAALEELALQSGFESINQYQWWVLPAKD
jgi:ribosomal protein S18 acetylase RimI-like enzyme